MVIPIGVKCLLQLLYVLGAVAVWALSVCPARSLHLLWFGPCASLLSPSIASNIDTQALYVSKTLLAFWSTSRFPCHCTASRLFFTGVVHRLALRGAANGRSSNNRYTTTTTTNTAGQPWDTSRSITAAIGYHNNIRVSHCSGFQRILACTSSPILLS
jgi:hypothetical protein